MGFDPAKLEQVKKGFDPSRMEQARKQITVGGPVAQQPDLPIPDIRDTAGTAKFLGQTVLPTAGMLAGGFGGAVIRGATGLASRLPIYGGEALGGYVGEKLNQMFGITPPSEPQALLSGVAGPVGRLIPAAAQHAVKIMPGYSHAVNEEASRALRALPETHIPASATKAKDLYQQVEAGLASGDDPIIQAPELSRAVARLEAKEARLRKVPALQNKGITNLTGQLSDAAKSEVIYNTEQGPRYSGTGLDDRTVDALSKTRRSTDPRVTVTPTGEFVEVPIRPPSPSIIDLAKGVQYSAPGPQDTGLYFKPSVSTGPVKPIHEPPPRNSSTPAKEQTVINRPGALRSGEEMVEGQTRIKGSDEMLPVTGPPSTIREKRLIMQEGPHPQSAQIADDILGELTGLRKTLAGENPSTEAGRGIRLSELYTIKQRLGDKVNATRQAADETHGAYKALWGAITSDLEKSNIPQAKLIRDADKLNRREQAVKTLNDAIESVGVRKTTEFLDTPNFNGIYNWMKHPEQKFWRESLDPKELQAIYATLNKLKTLPTPRVRRGEAPIGSGRRAATVGLGILGGEAVAGHAGGAIGGLVTDIGSNLLAEALMSDKGRKAIIKVISASGGRWGQDQTAALATMLSSGSQPLNQ